MSWRFHGISEEFDISIMLIFFLGEMKSRDYVRIR